MNTLRARVTLLLIVAIVTVVATASLIGVSLLRPPLPEMTVDPMARQLRLIADLVRHAADPGSAAPQSADVEQHPAPYPGEQIDRFSQALQDAMRRTGPDLPLRVTRPNLEAPAVISVEIAPQHWLWLTTAGLPIPQGLPLAFTSWMVMLVLGASCIAFIMVGIIVRPLTLIEDAIARIGPDGVLPKLPETGSAGMRSITSRLNRLSDRLRTAMESRMRLVAAAGHDLRTPMTRMRLRAEFLADDERAAWLADLDELDRIADSAIRLVREEVEGGDSEPLRLDLLMATICDELVGQNLPVRLDMLTPVSVRAGSLALKRALRNLIINAATHGKGAEIALTAAGAGAFIVIRDRGPGIPPALLDQAFEPFFRVDPARQQSAPGAGLGLAIAKEIIERYGGSILIANRPSGGLEQKVVFAEFERIGTSS